VIENALGLQTGSRAIEGTQVMAVVRKALERASVIKS